MERFVTVQDIVFLKKNRTFIMLVNRFMWEDVEKGVFRKNKRIRCAVKFENVLNVKSKNINQDDKDLMLELIAIDLMKNSGKFEISLFFNNNSCITLLTEIIEVTLEDQNKI